jgi:hypothetical protein
VRAHRSFDELPNAGKAAVSKSLKRLVEESPIRIFKQALGEEISNDLIAPTPALYRQGGRLSDVTG